MLYELDHVHNHKDAIMNGKAFTCYNNSNVIEQVQEASIEKFLALW